MKVKSIVTLLLAALIVVGLFAGCAQDSPGAGSPGGSSSASPSQSPASPAGNSGAPANSPGGSDPLADRLDVRWFARGKLDLVNYDVDFQNLLEDTFNITIDLYYVNDSNDEWAAFLLSGEVMDFYMGIGRNWYDALSSESLLAPVSFDIMKQYAPLTIAECVKIAGSDAAAASQMSSNGKLYGFTPPDTFIVPGSNMFIREDWIANVGAQPPKTLDDLHDLFVLFRDGDPSGDGKGRYGMTFPWLQYSMHPLFGAFGIAFNAWYVVGSEVVNTGTMKEFQDALIVFNKWYAEGLIDPEFVTDDRNVGRQKFYDGVSGIVVDHPWWMWSTLEGPWTVFQREFPGVGLYQFNPIGPQGKQGGPVPYPSLFGANNYNVFGKNSTEEMQIRLLMICESYMVNDYDFYIRGYYGEEGVAWNWVDGVMTVTELYNEENSKIGGKRAPGIGAGPAFANAPMTRRFYELTTIKEDLAFYEYAVDHTGSVYSGIAFLFDGTNDLYAERNGELQTIQAAFLTECIIGTKDPVADWDAYIAQLKNAGIDEVAAAWNEIRIK